MNPVVEFSQGDKWKAEVMVNGDVELKHLGLNISSLIVPEEDIKNVRSKRNLICGARGLGNLKLTPNAEGSVTVDGDQISEEKSFIEGIDAGLDIKARI